MDSKKIVWITGFGPFQNAPENKSWLGVKHMTTRHIEHKYGVLVQKQKVPVEYDFVDRYVPLRWKMLQPALAIHVGISSVDCFTLETQAFKSGYTIPDINGKIPGRGLNRAAGGDVLRTKLDVENICKQFNELSLAGGSLQAKVSNDPGRYLCGYIYYTSLSLGNALFVHVPVSKYSPKQLASGLAAILQLTLALMYPGDITRRDETAWCTTT